MIRSVRIRASRDPRRIVFPEGGHDKVLRACHIIKEERIARDNIEVAPFNPLAQGGAPRWTRSEKYRSGLIAVPQDF